MKWRIFLCISILSIFSFCAPITVMGLETSIQETEEEARSNEQLRASEDVYPKIGLVLSGGGARGFAHIGALKVLEELGMPIDYIVGTSMGSIIGGLYAAGYSVSEIEQVITEVNWDDVFSDTPPRKMWSSLKKLQSSKYLFGIGFTRKGLTLPQGITKGQKISTLFSFLTIPVSGVAHFDDFPIPFRAVATDIENGEAVILDRGSLADAMRASMSVPGFFTPVDIDGRLLVDGGVVNNLPVDVMQKMGADIIIAVDVSSDLVDREKLGNPLAILNQMIGLQILKATEKNRELADLLIMTDLEDYTSTDFNKGLEMSVLGEQSTRKHLEELQALLTEIKKTRPTSRSVPKSLLTKYQDMYIEDVVLTGDVQRDTSIMKYFQQYENASIDPEFLERTVSSIFSTGNYESVKFSLTPGQDEHGRVFNLKLQEKAVNPHLFRFGMYYETRQGAADDKMVMLLNATFNDLTGRGSWWSTDFEFVNVNKLQTQYFQPLFKGVFALPILYDSGDFQIVYRDQDADGRYDIDQTGGTFSLGTLLPRIGAVMVGYNFEAVTTKLIAESIPPEEYPETDGTVSSIQVQNSLDRLDDFPFPHSGGLFELYYEWADKQLGGTVGFHKLSADYWRYFSLATHHTLGAHLQLGSDFRSGLPAYREFLLGGRYSFVGYKAEEVRGKSIATLGLEYRYKFFELPAPIGKGIFATLIGNIGNAWRSLDELVAEIENSTYNPRYGGSIGLAMDTFLGPVTLDFALGDEGRQVFYFNIGTKF